MVYISIEADISALTYPNKRQAVCCPASAGGAGGGDRGGRKSEKKEKGGEYMRAGEDRNEWECPHNAIIFPSLPQVPEGKNTS